jgi:TonB family protein
MALAAISRAPKGPLWAKPEREERKGFTLRKAFFAALVIEAAMIVAFFSIDFERRWDEVRESRVIKAITAEAPAPEKKEIPPPPQKPVQKEQPKNTQEAAPVPVEATAANAAGVSTPERVGDVQQGRGAMTDTPSPSAVRSAASLTNQRECYQAFLGRYPREARRAGQEGDLVAIASIGPDGRVKDVVIRDARPRGVFERVVISVLTTACRFAPDPVGYRAEIPISFRLRGEVAEEK